MSSPFHIKICGVRRVEDAVRAADLGADAVGLNFYPGSRRCVDVRAAAEIARAVAGSVTRVGVFVNAAVDQIAETAEKVRLDAVQLHGDEPPQMIAGLAPLPVIRAFRCRDTGLKPVAAYLVECKTAGRLPSAVLLDAYAAGHYGGTGLTLNWAQLAGAREELEGLPIFLAGGLTPENVSQAIASSHCDGVDTASGVESSPGVKDPARLEGFIEAARSALGRT